TVGHREGDGGHDGNRPADALRPPARPGRTPGGRVRHGGPDADDPPRHVLARGVRPGRPACARQAANAAAGLDRRTGGAALIEISRAGEADLPELLPLLRGYCDFYEVTPSDEELLALSRALIADPERDGVQLLAR